jgi:hypothetical protein
MTRWKPVEESYLQEHAGDGAQAIADALGRSIPAVKTHASRMGVSLVRRWLCPRCGHWSYREPTKWSGWCRRCSIEESADTAAVKNREIRREIAEERRRIDESEHRRQAIYADTNRKKKELRRLRESCNRNATSKGEKG